MSYFHSGFAQFSVVLGVSLLLTACGSSRWSESHSALCDSTMSKMGPDTYMATGKYGNGCGTDYGIRHAAVFCSQRGKESLVKRVDPEANHVIFRCLSTGDTELQRPTYGREPDVQIDVQ